MCTLGQLYNPNIPDGYCWNKFKIWFSEEKFDLFIYFYIMFLSTIIYCFLFLIIRDKFLNMKIFKDIRKSKFYRRHMIAGTPEKNLTLVISKTTVFIIVCQLYKQGFIHENKYLIIIALTFCINLFYNLSLSFYKKRELNDLKNYLKIDKEDFLFRSVFEEDRIKKASRLRRFFLYCLTRNCYMFPLSFISYYNSFHGLFVKNKIWLYDFWLKKKVNNYTYFYSEVYWKLMNFIFINFMLITIFSFFFSLYYKFSLENHESLNKTPFISIFINFTVLYISLFVLFNDYLYELYFLNRIPVFYKKTEFFITYYFIYVYMPFIQIPLFIWFYYYSKHFCYQIGSFINYKKESNLYQKFPKII